MSAPLGVRVCQQLGCLRRTHVTETGVHYSRCIGHTLLLLSGAFADPSRATESAVPPVAGSVVLPASSVRRPAA
jgi:hypothetical protein